ncbi:hypothetical protein K7X08_027907 [Anisodus acutangulus]|uniref:Uncharacterized protein n=1 Tax=Anisodus acutangulus TaxID=402998 RepID=A0A9Q1MY14_9SOLA|nr:hypothetical protein K7X08_027907 [Anisodus acutangulus]
MSSLLDPVTKCTTGAIEGPSVVNPEKFPLGAAVGSELNSSFSDVDEFLISIEDLITIPAEGTSGAWCGVDTRTSPSLSLQPSIAGASSSGANNGFESIVGAPQGGFAADSMQIGSWH